MSDNTGLQKNYILCTANLKKQTKKQTNLQTRRLHTNTPCTSITLSHGYFSTPRAWVSFSNNTLSQNTLTASLNRHVKWIEYKGLYCIFSSWLAFLSAVDLASKLLHLLCFNHSLYFELMPCLWSFQLQILKNKTKSTFQIFRVLDTVPVA